MGGLGYTKVNFSFNYDLLTDLAEMYRGLATNNALWLSLGGDPQH